MCNTTAIGGGFQLEPKAKNNSFGEAASLYSFLLTERVVELKLV